MGKHYFVLSLAHCLMHVLLCCTVLSNNVLKYFEVFRRKMISQYVGVDLVKRISTCTYSFMIMQDIWRCT